MTRRKILLPLLILLSVCVSGCGTRTIYLKTGEPVRLRQEVRNCKIWVYDKDGNMVASEMDLPEGWYCLPDPGR